jgi:vancomycin permeability regulator SanA
MNEILINAETIYNYLNIKENLTDSDLILGCGCMDTTIVEICNVLYKQLHSQKIIFSGKSGKGTIGKISSSEAQRFKNYAIELGMPSEKILLEEHARTTKENIKKSIKKVKFEKITIVHKPYVLKRCDQICKKLKINHLQKLLYEEY